MITHAWFIPERLRKCEREPFVEWFISRRSSGSSQVCSRCLQLRDFKDLRTLSSSNPASSSQMVDSHPAYLPFLSSRLSSTWGGLAVYSPRDVPQEYSQPISVKNAPFSLMTKGLDSLNHPDDDKTVWYYYWILNRSMYRLRSCLPFLLIFTYQAEKLLFEREMIFHNEITSVIFSRLT